MKDPLDQKILALLQQNGSLSYTDLARKLRMSESTVRKRVLTLQKNKIIRKFSVEVDPAKLGYTTISILGIDVEASRLFEVAQKLCELEEVKSVATSAGQHSIIAEVWAEDGRNFSRLMSERILSMDGVLKVSPSLILEKLKG